MNARIVALTLVGAVVAKGNRIVGQGFHRKAGEQHSFPQDKTPLPAEPPFGGVMWSFVVPAVLFVIAAGATVLLYRRFAGRDR